LFNELLLFVFVMVLILPPPSHTIVGRIELCVYACREALNSARFATTSKTLFGMHELCRHYLRLASGYACAKVHCPPDENRAGVAMLAERCRINAGLAIPSVAAQLADAALRRGVHRFNGSTVLDGVPAMGKAQLRAGVPFNAMVYLARELLEPAYRTRVGGAAISTPSAATLLNSDLGSTRLVRCNMIRGITHHIYSISMGNTSFSHLISACRR
jgi:hypothetical protein